MQCAPGTANILRYAASEIRYMFIDALARTSTYLLIHI
jgi:hypothetical protein